MVPCALACTSDTPGYASANLVFAIAFLLCAWNLFRAASLEPGYAPRAESESQRRMVVEQLADEARLNGMNYCVNCMVRAPVYKAAGTLACVLTICYLHRRHAVRCDPNTVVSASDAWRGTTITVHGCRIAVSPRSVRQASYSGAILKRLYPSILHSRCPKPSPVHHLCDLTGLWNFNV